MRAAGEAQFSVAQLRDRSIVTRLYHQSPMRLFAPRAPEQMPWLVATSLGGGLVSGDRLRVEGDLGPGSSLYLGTQAVTKVYRGAAEQHAEVKLGAASLLAMVSDPVLCFAGAAYRQTLRFTLAEDASLLLVDGLLAGRVHHGEAWQFDSYESRVTVTRGATTIVEDALRLRASDGSLAARAGRFSALQTIWAVGPRLTTLAHSWRELARTNQKGGEVWLAHGEPRPEVHVLRIAATSHQSLIETQKRVLDLAAILGEDPLLRRY